MNPGLRQSVPARAWDDCYAAVGNATGAGLGVLAAAAFGVLGSFLFPVDTVRAQAVLGASLLILAFFALAAVAYLAFFAITPYRLRREALSRVDALEEERIPRFAAMPRSGRRYHDIEHQHLMWAELDVTNLSPTLHLRDVEIRIRDLVDELEWDENGERVRNLPPIWNPIQSIWSLASASRPNQNKMAIPPGETRTALIAYSDDSNGPPAAFSAPDGVRRHLMSGPHRIYLSVSSPDSARLDCDFYIECHPNYAIPGIKRGTFARYADSTMTFDEWGAYWKRRSEEQPANAAASTSTSPSSTAVDLIPIP